MACLDSVGTGRAIWGASPTAIHFSGDPTKMCTWNGSTVLGSPIAGMTGIILSIDGAPGTDIAFVGSSSGQIARGKPGSWTLLPTGTTNAIWDIWAPNADFLYAVGSDGLILKGQFGSFSRVPSPTTAELRTIHGTDFNNVYAAGGAVMIHFDGSEWRSLPTEKAHSLYMAPGFGKAAAGQLLSYSSGDLDGCADICLWSYPRGTVVDLVATPDQASAFIRWGGACRGIQPTCSLTIAETTFVTATFGPD